MRKIMTKFAVNYAFLPQAGSKIKVRCFEIYLLNGKTRFGK